MITSKIKLYVSSLLMLLVLTHCSTTETEMPTTENPVKLAKPELIAPLQGAENQANNIELTWKSATDVQNYHIMISGDADFDSTVVDEVIENKSYKAELSAGVTYYWKIRALNNGISGSWSDVWHFSTATIEKEPVSVALISPTSGEIVKPADIIFEWEAVSDEAKYHFQISQDADFNTTAVDTAIGTSTFVVSELEGEKDYFWRVSPILESETGMWSELNTFTTEAAPVEETPEPTPDPTPQPNPSNTGFVSTQNADFVLNGQTFRVVGTNAYHLPNYEKIDPSVVDRAMDSFEDAGVNVIRVWGFYDGQPQYSGDITLQPEAGVYNEEDLVRLDKVMAKSKEHGVKVVLALVNYWDQLGGINKYNEWAGQSGNLYGDAMLNFITGDKQQKWFKDYISMLLNRVNTVTGVAYKDDPAIFAWEIMNEGRNRGSDPQVIRDWYQEIAQYIKSIDSNHMVSTGEEGFDEGTPAEYSVDQYTNTYILRAQEGTSYIMNTQIPEIDYGTAHWYPADWGWHVSSWDVNSTETKNLLSAQKAWIMDHVEIAENAGKPFLMGEYGFPGWGDERVEGMYNDFWKIAESIELDGSLLWQLTPDYTKCYEFGGNICWPGGRGDEELYLGFKAHIGTMKALK